jgi:hypothetical protein
MSSNQNHSWPHWFPKGNTRCVKLTNEQLAYILPAFTSCGANRRDLDNVSLCEGRISGIPVAIKEFCKRFKYSDIDISNLLKECV